MGNSAKRDERDAERHERMREALRLRKQRLSYEAISKTMGVTRSTAHALVHDAIAEIPREDAKDVLVLELLDLDRQERRATKIARESGDSEVRLKAEQTILRIKERRSKYLGLDAPTKAETKTTVGFGDDLSDEELERRWQEARKRDAEG